MAYTTPNHPLERVSDRTASGYIGPETIDLARGKGMPLEELERFLEEVRHQPHWRLQADIEADYYDGNQLAPGEVAELTDLGLSPLIVNLIKPTVDLVLGMEERARRDWMVRPETDDHEDMAQALTVKLKEAERTSMADRACSDAYAGQVKVGVHWVGVGRPMDPFGPKYRVEDVHRREMWWDWRASDPLLRDARWIIRKKWYDLDVLMAAMPQHKDIFAHAISGQDWAEWDWTRAIIEPQLTRDYFLERDTTIEELEWRQTERRRFALHEVWYKTWNRGYVLDIPEAEDDIVVEFERKNPMHRELVTQMGLVPRVALIPKIRMALWCGPYRLEDVPNPFPFNHFPYVPFFGHREDRTRVPYGIIRAMKSPQDEVNARRRKMLWLLSAKRVIADEDAVHGKDHAKIAREINRPEVYIKLNPARTNKDAGAFRVEQDFQLARQQFDVMMNAAEMIQASAGVYQEMLGGGKEGQSGIAIANLVEQGTTTLAELNANYQLARTQVGELLMALVKEDLEARIQRTGQPVTVQVREKFSRKRKPVILAGTWVDEKGVEHTTADQEAQPRTNDLSRTRARVVLDEVPSTSTFKQQSLQQLSEIVKSLPPELQAAMMDMVIEATDLKDKDAMADRMRRLTGQEQADPEQMSEEELAAAQAEAQAAAEMQALERAGIEAEVAAKQAEAQAKMAQIEREAQVAAAQVQKLQAEAATIGVDDGHQAREMQLKAALEQAKRQHDERLEAMRTEIKEQIAQMQANAADKDRALETRKLIVDSALKLQQLQLQREEGRRQEAQAAEERASRSAEAERGRQFETEREERTAQREEDAGGDTPKKNGKAKSLSGGEKTAAAPAQPIVVNVDARPGARRIDLERDEAGRLAGATVTDGAAGEA